MTRTGGPKTDIQGRVYLDNAATTPVRPEARTALVEALEHTGNGSAAHAAGREARRVIETAREQSAAVLGVRADEIIFTSGGTEADNLALKGIVWAAQRRGRSHVVTSAIEHPAVAETCRWLATHQGLRLTVVPPSSEGTMDPERVLDAVRPDTAVVSIMTANNELGAINDISPLVAPLRERGVALHTDAVQAAATHDLTALDVDAMAVSGHKIGAPQGVGLTVLRTGLSVEPLHHGGGQDRQVRSGTFASALDASLGAGLQAAARDRERLTASATRQTDRLAAGLLALGGITRNGPSSASQRLPTHLHVGIDGVDAAALTRDLDRRGIQVAAGSACSAGAVRASAVVAACGIRADAVLRLTVGWATRDEEIDRALDVLVDTIKLLRHDRGSRDSAEPVP